MKTILNVTVSSAVLASVLLFAVHNCANAADEFNAAKSPVEAEPRGEQGLVGYWSFDEGKGEVTKDRSKNGNDGNITGPKWAKGVTGSALEFNGVNDYLTVRTPANGIGEKAVSVEAWIQSSGNNANASLVFAGPNSPDFGLWIQGGRFCGGIWSSADTLCCATSSISPTAGQWHHVAMTCDFDAGKVVKLYLDGILDSTCASTGTAIKGGHTTIDIGGRSPNSWYFNGIIDEVKIYNRALSDEEIRKTYDDYIKKRAAEIDTTGYKNSPWVWTENPEHRTVYFRKSFTAPDVGGKKAFMVCDGDNYEVFLNGRAIIPGKDYSEAQIVDITGELKNGVNVIAAQATNSGSNTGFFTYLGYPRKESPEGYEKLAGGDGMKCSAQPMKDWYSPDFDDSKWKPIHKIADFDNGLALKRNFPDLGFNSKAVHNFAPPEFENGTTMRFANDGLILVLQYAGNKHSFQVEDSVTHEKWFMPGPPFLIDDQVSAWDGAVRCEKVEDGFQVTSSDFEKYPGLSISYKLALRNRYLEVTLDPIRFPADRKNLSVSFPLDFGAARAGEEGYLLSSIGNYDAREGRMFPFGMDVSRYRNTEGFEVRGEATLPFFGIVRRGHPCVTIITDFPAAAYELKTSVGQNSNGFTRLYSTTPIWGFEKDRVNESRHLRYQFLEKGGYVEAAKAYRQFLLSTGRYATLRERVKQHPVCSVSVNASFFWGAYSLSDMPVFMAKLKKSGVNKAVLQVANRNDFVGGWKRWPEGMTPASSTTEEFKNVADVARKMGYGFSPVDEYTPFSDRGQDYDASLRAMKRDGSYYSFETEKTFFLCESQKLRFAQRDLPHVKEIIGECPYLLDCEGCSEYECFDPRHPLTSRQLMLERREFLTYVRNTMGSVVSEGSPLDWLTDIIDVGHGHSIGFKYWESKPGVFIPLWSLVYGGAVVDLFNAPGPKDGMLYAALYGLNARFNDYQIAKTQLEWHKRTSDAWPDRNYYEMTNHEFLAPLVQKSRFRESNRIVDVVANFGDVEFGNGNQIIPPHDFRVFVGGNSSNH